MQTIFHPLMKELMGRRSFDPGIIKFHFLTLTYWMKEKNMVHSMAR